MGMKKNNFLKKKETFHRFVKEISEIKSTTKVS